MYVRIIFLFVVCVCFFSGCGGRHRPAAAQGGQGSEVCGASSGGPNAWTAECAAGGGGGAVRHGLRDGGNQSRDGRSFIFYVMELSVTCE